MFSKCSTHGYYLLKTSCISKPRFRGSFRDLKFPIKFGKLKQQIVKTCILKPRIRGTFRDLKLPGKSGKCLEFAIRCLRLSISNLLQRPIGDLLFTTFIWIVNLCYYVFTLVYTLLLKYLILVCYYLSLFVYFSICCWHTYSQLFIQPLMFVYVFVVCVWMCLNVFGGSRRFEEGQ